MQSLGKKINTKWVLFVRMLSFEKEFVSISLKNYMPFENRKRKKNLFWERFQQSLNKYIPAENKIRKNKSSEDFLLNSKQVLYVLVMSRTCLRVNPHSIVA